MVSTRWAAKGSNTALDSQLDHSPHPLLGVPAADRGRAGPPRAQALRGAGRATGSRSTCSPAAARSRRPRRSSAGSTSTASASRRGPTDLGEFVAWVERMNSDMLAAGVELGDRYDFDLVHGHDWLVAIACDHLARRFGAPLVTTIHATEHGRHQGWVDKHPQSLHPRRRALDHQPLRPRDRLLVLHARADRRHLRRRRERVAVIPNGIDPEDLQPQDGRRARAPARRVRRPGREARAADRPARLREGLPARARGDAAR